MNFTLHPTTGEGLGSKITHLILSKPWYSLSKIPWAPPISRTENGKDLFTKFANALWCFSQSEPTAPAPWDSGYKISSGKSSFS